MLIIRFKYVTEAFSLYSEIAWCLPLTPEETVPVNTPDIYIEQDETCYIDQHVHESCMHVDVRVLHSCAFSLFPEFEV